MLRLISNRYVYLGFLLALQSLLFVGSAFAQSQYQFERMWPNLPQPWYFQEIMDVATDEQGNIWVVDNKGNNVLQKFNQQGQLIRSTRLFLTSSQKEEIGYSGFQALPLGNRRPLIKVHDNSLYTLGLMREFISADGQWKESVGVFQFDLDLNFQKFTLLPLDESYFGVNGYQLSDFDIDEERILVLTSDFDELPDGTQVDKTYLHLFSLNGEAVAIHQPSDKDFSYFRAYLVDNNVVAVRNNGCVYIYDVAFTKENKKCLNLAIPEDTHFYLLDFEPILEDGKLAGGYAYHLLFWQAEHYVSKIDERLDIEWQVRTPYLSASWPQTERIMLNSQKDLLVGGTAGLFKLSNNGQFLESFSSSGTAEHYFSFNGISGTQLVANNSTIALIQRFKNTVSAFNYRGTKLTQFELDSSYGELSDWGYSSKRIIAIDEKSNVYVVQLPAAGDWRENRADQIVKYDLNGNVLKVFNFAGDEDYGSFTIQTIEVDSSGSIELGVNYRRNEENCKGCGAIEIRRYVLDSNGKILDYQLLYDPDKETDTNVEYVQLNAMRSIGNKVYLVGTQIHVTYISNLHTFQIYEDGKLVKRLDDSPGDNDWRFDLTEMHHWPGGFLLADSALWGNGLSFVDYEGNADEHYFRDTFAEGSLPGQMEASRNLSHSVAVTDNHMVIFDAGNHRLQIFKKVEKLNNAKAIIVAGGGLYNGNSLWDATLTNANLAYRTLISQGYSKESIKYFANENFDLDGNGALDDFAGPATNANVKTAITEWASDADNLVLYLVDHGGENTFRMGKTELMQVDSLNVWLNNLEGAMSGGVTVVYDACKSGSFINELAKQNRTIITSSKADENAYFLSQGAVSFSSFFWQNVFNGQDLKTAFHNARSTIHSNAALAQSPQLSVDGVLLGEDLSRLGNTTIGNGTLYAQSAPTIEYVSGAQTIKGVSQATLTAQVAEDPDGIGRVWGIIWPPSYKAPVGVTPVLDLPTVEFVNLGNGKYQAVYGQFDEPGIYQIAIYARDGFGNTALPKTTSVTVDSPFTRKALLIGGGVAGDQYQPSVNNNLAHAYNALRRQGFDDDEIYFLAAEAVSEGIDGLNLIDNVQYGLSTWLGNNTSELVVYLVGPGPLSKLTMSNGNLTSAQLGQWLKTAQFRVKGTISVVLDTHQAGYWLPKLQSDDGNRIVIAATGNHQMAHWLGGSTSSFSEYFWRQIQTGSSVRKAFVFAKKALNIPGINQTAQMDDNGNGISNEKSDGRYARKYWLGSGLTTAGDEPVITDVSPPQRLSGESTVSLYATGITSTSAITEVKATVIYPHQNGALAESQQILLDDMGNGRYEGEFNDAARFSGYYSVTFSAANVDGYVSLPAQSHFVQTVGADVYEVDEPQANAPIYSINDDTLQWHTLHSENDSDWLMVYLGTKDSYTIAADNPGYRLDVQINLYNSSGDLIDSIDEYIEGEGESIVFEPTHSGVYYIEVSHSEYALYTQGHDMDYSLSISSDTGEFPGDLSGYISYEHGEPVAQASLLTSHGMTGMTYPNGAYLLSKHAVGEFELTVTLPDQSDFQYPFVIREAAVTTLDIVLSTAQEGQPVLTKPADIALITHANTPLPITHDKIVEFLDSASAVDSQGNVLTVTHNAPESIPIGLTEVTFTAIDNNGQSAQTSATIWLDFVDVEKPVVSVPADLEIIVNQSEQVSLTHPQIVTFLAAAAADDNIDGRLSVSHDAPEQFSAGTTLVNFYATDEAGNTGVASAKVNVRINSAPVFTSSPPQNVDEDALYQYVISVSDELDDIADEPTIEALTIPQWLTLQNNVLQGTPGQLDIGEHQIVLSSGDARLDTLQAYTLVVNAVNDKPNFTTAPLTKIVEGQQYQFTVLVTDEEGDEVTVTAAKLPDWLELEGALISGTPRYADIGTHEVKLVASDGQAQSELSWVLLVIDGADMLSWLKLLLHESQDKPNKQQPGH